jgi:hypothetical protein
MTIAFGIYLFYGKRGKYALITEDDAVFEKLSNNFFGLVFLIFLELELTVLIEATA